MKPTSTALALIARRRRKPPAPAPRGEVPRVSGTWATTVESPLDLWPGEGAQSSAQFSQRDGYAASQALSELAERRAEQQD